VGRDKTLHSGVDHFRFTELGEFSHFLNGFRHFDLKGHGHLLGFAFEWVVFFHSRFNLQSKGLSVEFIYTPRLPYTQAIFTYRTITLKSLSLWVGPDLALPIYERDKEN
jgi:hypothetical protein